MAASVRRQVVVNAGPQRAFELFVGHIGAWWPLDRFGVLNEGTVAFEGDRLVERSGDREAVWGEVTEWSPPDMVAFTWHPGYESAHGTEIRVTFEQQGDQTLLTLVHTGWERMSDPEASAQEYGNNWPTVLTRFARLVDEVPA